MPLLYRGFPYDVATVVEDLTDVSDGNLGITIQPPTIYGRIGGQWVPLASLEGATIPEPTLVSASETQAGVAEIATQDEVNAGGEVGKIVTPARLAGRTATETRSGVVELATAAETQAGTDTARAVHPAGLKAATTPEAWIAPVLQNGWANAGSTHANAGYRKTPWGEVQLRGTISGGTMTNGTPVLNLPAGYRPANTRTFPGVFAAGSACRITVNTDGDVTIASVTNNATLSLESVRFDP